jgi:hypothetical protein
MRACKGFIESDRSTILPAVLDGGRNKQCPPRGNFCAPSRHDTFSVPDKFRGVRIHEVTGWKWAGDPRVLVCIIAALIFTIWVALQQIYY